MPSVQNNMYNKLNDQFLLMTATIDASIQESYEKMKTY